MKFLFICDDKEQWAIMMNMITAISQKNTVVCVIKETEAVDHILNEGDISCFIIDADHRKEDPKVLADTFTEMAGEKPIIFVGRIANLKSRVMSDLYEESETEIFLERPFTPDHLRAVIEKVKSWNERENFEQSMVDDEADSFSPMRIKNFYYYKQLPYDVYLQVTESKYAKVIQKNQSYNHALIQKYVQKKVKNLYLYKEEKLKFLEDSISKLEMKLQPGKITDSKELLSQQVSCASIITEYLQSIGISESVQRITDLLIDSVMGVAPLFKNLTAFLSAYPLNRDFISAQAVLCMYFSEFVGQRLGWKSPMIRKKLAFACLIHDIGLASEEYVKFKTLDDPNLMMFSQEDKIAFETHPKRSAELSSLFSGYPETEFILEQHHELPDGSGFPKGLNGNVIQPISALFILINNFTTDLYSLNLLNGKPQLLLKHYKEAYKTGNFRDPLKALEFVCS